MREAPGRGDKYELVRRIASGGMADVYLARMRGPGGFVRHVILKGMRATSPEARSMFLDEARVLGLLHHQSIAQVYDLIAADGGDLFLALEYVHGQTLQAALHEAELRSLRIPLDFALTVVEATAMALHHAHERCDSAGRPLGIVHRDVTPANVMATFDGGVKLIDFGIASAFDRVTETDQGVIKGKTRYMAPEQAMGSVADRRTDVFGLGVILYELTTQTRAFPACGPLEILRREVRPPSEVRAGYYPVLEDIVMTAMARDAGYRFPDADAMARAVRAAASQLGLAVGPAAIMRTMHRIFGERREPWLLVPPRRLPSIPEVTGAGGTWTSTSDTADSTARFLALEEMAPIAPGTLAVGTREMPCATDPELPAREVDAPGAIDLPEPTDVVAVDEAVEVVDLGPFAPDTPLTMSRTRTSLLPWRVRARSIAAQVTVAAAVIVGVWLASEHVLDGVDAPAPQPEAPPSAAPTESPRVAPTPAVGAAPPAPAAREVRVHIESNPADATIVWNGKRLGRGPVDLVVPRSEREVPLKVRRRGYKARTLTVHLGADRHIEVELEPRARSRR